MSVIIETSIGDITVDLYTDQRPRCSFNFLKLCKMKYYNFSLFHTVQQNLMAQTGDPTGTGRGGESIFSKMYGEQARFFDMEMSPRIKHTRKGLVSMVNNGHDMHGSQFFITLADNLDYLDGKHTVFGEVVEGSGVLEKLNNTFCDEDNRPFQDIRIYHTIILDDPYDDPDNLEIPSMSPFPTEEMLNSDHIACDANIDEDKDKTEEELAEMMAEKEAKANTQILEMVGDLPDVDVAPPENVLFVCKLNPVTTSEDLEIIFSRFGPIVNCDVIKDSKTGESLQYAFIEFENPEHCESAYFKMDNVLIDDRRIHVDFSQSVSKLKWKGKGKGVEIMSTGDAPIYVLKNQERQHGQYDLVYEHDEANNDKGKDVQIKKRKTFSQNENKSHHKQDDSLSPVRGATKKHKKDKGSYSEVKSTNFHRRSRDREDDTQNEQELPTGKFKSSRERNSDSRIKSTEGSERNSVKRNNGKNGAREDKHKKYSNVDSKLTGKRVSYRDDQDTSPDSSQGNKQKKKKKHGKHKKLKHK